MKKLLLLFTFLFCITAQSQSVIQSVNSGSLITSSSSISIGEIVITPQNQQQSSTGIIGILAQVNSQNLEVPELALNEKITVFPNPTINSITFQTENKLQNEKVNIVSITGQIVSKKQISDTNSLDLSELQNGVYIIEFENKSIPTFKIIKR